MKLHALKKLEVLVALAIATLGGAVIAAPCQAAEPMGAPDSLVAVHTWDFDHLYLLPNSNLAAYRKVMIDPVRIAFAKDWNQSEQDYRGKTRLLRADDVRAIADDLTSGMQRSIADAFKANGYEIVSAPGPGVLRLTPSATDVYVNAGDQTPPGMTRLYTKDAGEATLILEARDSVSGKLFAQVVDHRTARESKGTRISDVRRTTNVTNTFWFDDMVRLWAGACAKQFETAKG
jgi:Protein of unknown function (DUF3313)